MIVPSDIFNRTIPSKVFDYLSFGIPIIATVQGEGKKIILQSQSNIVTSLIESRDLANAFVKMRLNFDFYNEHAYVNKEIAQNFSREKSTDEFYKICEAVIK